MLDTAPHSTRRLGPLFFWAYKTRIGVWIHCRIDGRDILFEAKMASIESSPIVVFGHSLPIDRQLVRVAC